MGLLADDLRVVPGGEGAEHVAAHDEEQLIRRVLLSKMGQREGGIAGALPVQLPVGGHKACLALASQLDHAVSLLAAGTLGQLLVGWDAVHHQDDLIETQRVLGAAGHIQMSVVDGVEASP